MSFRCSIECWVFPYSNCCWVRSLRPEKYPFYQPSATPITSKPPASTELAMFNSIIYAMIAVNNPLKALAPRGLRLGPGFPSNQLKEK